MIAFITSLAFILPFLVITGIVMIISLERNKEAVASTFFSLATALILWTYGPEIWEFITQNIATTIYFSVGYVILGLIWSFIKWNQKVKNIFRTFGRLKTKFIEKYGAITDGNKEEFYKTLKDKFWYSDYSGKHSRFDKELSQEKVIKEITPKGIDNKGLIVSWISYWPLSLIGTLLNDPFRRFFEWIYESVSGFYDKITVRQKNKYIG